MLLSGCSYGLHVGKKCLESDKGTAWSYLWLAESGVEINKCNVKGE